MFTHGESNSDENIPMAEMVHRDQPNDKIHSSPGNSTLLLNSITNDSRPNRNMSCPNNIPNADRPIKSVIDLSCKNYADEGNHFATNTRQDNEIDVVDNMASHSGYIRQMEVKNRSQTAINCSYSMRSVGSIYCRICHNAEDSDSLVSPCLCSGTMAYVHKGCLERWLNTSGTIHCELCHYRLPIKMSLRYGLFQSLQLWFRHPNNRGLLQADVVVCSLLSVVTFGIIAISFLGLYMLQENRIGLSRLWTQGSIVVFLVVVVFAYCVNLFLILKAELMPWFRWWQSARQVKLIFIDTHKVRNELMHRGFGLRKDMELPIDVDREIHMTNISTLFEEQENNPHGQQDEELNYFE